MEDSFAARLWHRRVPQYLGMYVAATWLAIEMGDWMTERFGLPEMVTSYVFVGMLALLPSVAVLAWGHGAPGRDKWTVFEAVFLPVNALLAALAISILIEPSHTVSATEILDVVNEDGQIETYEVPLEGFHQDVLAMFWQSPETDQSESWLDYGLPALLAQDLSRSPLLSMETPFDSAGLRESLKQYGFADGRVSGKAVSLQLARERGYEFMLAGDWQRLDDGSYRLTARLFDVQVGELRAELSRQGGRWFELIDQLSSDIRQELAQSTGGTSSLVTDLAVSEHFSESIEAIKLWVEASVARSFANDYSTAIEALNQAVALDPTFSAANGQLGMYYRLNAQNTEGIKAIDQALRHDYKLSTRDRFTFRATRYAMIGDTPKAVRVLEMWTEIEAQSVDALKLLASNYMVLGGHLDQASAAFAAVRKLDPQDVDTYLAQAQVEQQRNDFVAANIYIDQYLAARPEDYRGLLLQGTVRDRVGELDGARESFENAAILQGTEINADLGLIGLDLKQSRFEQAQRRVDALLEQPLTIQQQVAVRDQSLTMLATQGRLSAALELAAELNDLAKSFMIPLVRIMNVGARLATFHAQKGEWELAMALLDEMATQVDPPMDGIVIFLKLGILEIGDQREQFEQTMKDVQAFREQVEIPFLDPVILRYQALQASWDGQFDHALELQGEALEMMQSSILALQDPKAMFDFETRMAVYLNQTGRTDEAIERLERVLALNPVDPDAKIELAEFLIQKGEMDAASQILGQLFDLWSEADPEFLSLQRAKALSKEILPQ